MESITVHALVSKYSAWCVKHRSRGTATWYEGHHRSFLKHPGIGEILAAALKPYHVQEWVDSHDNWGCNHQRGAIIAVQRVYSWAIEQGYLETNPIQKMKKPGAKRREDYIKAEDYPLILKEIREGDPFREFFLFVWATGCRPQEARHIEPRHVELDKERIVFPAEESKGKRAKRIIYMQGVALEIITRLMGQYPDGKLFRNCRGVAWTKFAVCNRFLRISKILGKRLFAYGARHNFGTRKLLQGHDAITVATLMGHADATMLSKVYAHVSDDEAHLKRALAD